MGRFCYTIKQIRRHRGVLKAYRQDRTWHCASVLALDVEQLSAQDVKVLILDFDGVLASHGEPEPREDVKKWLDQAVKNFKGRLFILSNKPNQIRENFFKQHYPTIQFIKGVRKKPYPDGLLMIQEIAKAKPEEMVLVDDRLLTGILAAVSIQSKAIWIRKPYASFKKHFWSECFFASLRWLESRLI